MDTLPLRDVIISEEKDDIVVMGNKLVEARYSLKPIEQRIIFALISQINVFDTDFYRYKFSLSDLIDLCEIASETNAHRQIHSSAKALLSRRIDYTDDQNEVSTSWLSSVQNNRKDDTITFSFDPILKPHLLQLKQEFTRLEIVHLMKFKHKYSSRIYCLLKQYEKIKKRTITVDDLRTKLQTSKTYNNYGNLKNRILLPVIEEINLLSDIHISMKEIKAGGPRSEVLKLQFTIISKEEEAKNEKNAKKLSEKPIYETRELKLENILQILKQYVKPTIAGRFIAVYGGEYCLQKIELLEKEFTKGRKIKNKGGWLSKAINEDYEDYETQNEENENAKNEEIKNAIIEEQKKQDEQIDKAAREGNSKDFLEERQKRKENNKT